MTKVWKKCVLFPILLALLLTSIFVVPASAAYNDETHFDCGIIYMENLDLGTVIFDLNSEEQTPMASLTKLTTALVVLKNAEDLDEKITVTQEELNEIAGTNSSTAGCVAGEVLTIRQLLNLLLVKSANEAAIILAHEIAGDTDSFVKLMNEYAADLGCTNTHYVNPHGLDSADHYTTARDLALICKEGLKNETFKKIVSQSTYTLPKTNKREETEFESTNILLDEDSAYHYSAAKGIKTGTTEGAGHCLASYATRNGYTYLCIAIEGGELYQEREETNDSDQYCAFNDSIRAYEWAFDYLKLKTVAEPTDIVTVVDVELARKTDHLQLVPAQEVSALIPYNIDTSGISIEPVEGSIPKDLKAPIKAGDVVGKATVKYAGETLCTIDLVAAATVHRSFFGTIGYYLKKFFSLLPVKIILAIAIVTALLYFLLNYLNNQRRRGQQVHIVRIRNNPAGSGQNLRDVNSKPRKRTATKGKKKSSSQKRKTTATKNTRNTKTTKGKKKK